MHQENSSVFTTITTAPRASNLPPQRASQIASRNNASTASSSLYPVGHLHDDGKQQHLSSPDPTKNQAVFGKASLEAQTSQLTKDSQQSILQDHPTNLRRCARSKKPQEGTPLHRHRSRTRRNLTLSKAGPNRIPDERVGIYVSTTPNEEPHSSIKAQRKDCLDHLAAMRPNAIPARIQMFADSHVAKNGVLVRDQLGHLLDEAYRKSITLVLVADIARLSNHPVEAISLIALLKKLGADVSSPRGLQSNAK
jgi:uncharacterized membrane-anchored protein